MTPSDLVPKFLASAPNEGCKLSVYRDQHNLPTIGIGHLLTRDEWSSGKIPIAGVMVKYGQGITQEQVDTLCLQDVGKAAAAVNDNVAVDLTQYQFDALCLFAFNVGAGAFKNSTLVRDLNQGRYDEVPDQMRLWIHVGGERCGGLVARREREITVWEGRFDG